MENPSQDIHAVFDLIDNPHPPEIQRAAIEKYFLPEAGFRYPVYAIEQGPNSRAKVLAVYRWLHFISTRTKGSITHVMYDKSRDVLMLDVTQHLQLRYMPFNPSKSRMITRLTLKKHGGLHYIALQEDFMHPDAAAGLLFPPLKSAVHYALVLMGLLLSKLMILVGMMNFMMGRVEKDKEMIKAKRRERRRRKNANGQSEPVSAEEIAAKMKDTLGFELKENGGSAEKAKN
ncbi:hypothetical protein FA15DRAFT_700153 [Coprinopsis marcescibilis]|uniref:SigF-like NTF2-like domain-containing protein n=1 Tax=Coprinopsis marcescibilis TaxID=230819 RepID=A0A5C3L9X4_COPMA|nr:hypothetical protein FA15DRAFT_700153 [Coprinopsis marcescibilis]